MGLRTRFRRTNNALYSTPRWKSVRFLAKRRDGFKCVLCGAVGRLEVDHKKPLRDHPELAFDLSNLQTLCVSCHARKTRIEVGLGDMKPDRKAWADLIYSMRREHKCSKA